MHVSVVLKLEDYQWKWLLKESVKSSISSGIHYQFPSTLWCGVMYAGMIEGAQSDRDRPEGTKGNYWNRNILWKFSILSISSAPQGEAAPFGRACGAERIEEGEWQSFPFVLGSRVLSPCPPPVTWRILQAQRQFARFRVLLTAWVRLWGRRTTGEGMGNEWIRKW